MPVGKYPDAVAVDPETHTVFVADDRGVSVIDGTTHTVTATIGVQGGELAVDPSTHTVYVNPTARKVSTVPRHREINEFMAKKICRELEIDDPGKVKKPEPGEQNDAADSR